MELLLGLKFNLGRLENKMDKYKVFPRLSDEQEKKIENEIRMMLHAHRDCLRNRGIDTTKVSFDVRDGYYGEAFGILRSLRVLGYGYFGPINIPNEVYGKSNLSWWMRTMEEQVLEEEGFQGNNKCDYCLDKYRKDGVRKKSWRSTNLQ